MSDYTLTQKEYKSLKGALTRAKNSKCSQKVLTAVDRAFNVFNQKGWPDDWSNWQRAKDDALMDRAYINSRKGLY